MTISCSSEEFEHEGQCCKRCPKGKYVSVECSSSSPTKCETCPQGTFMIHSNFLHKCMPCTQCHGDNQHEIQHCEADSDRKCECKDGFYCESYESNNHCQVCIPLTSCPPGTGVSSKPIKDTICRPCTSGTFSNVTDYKSPCLNYTNCTALGRHLKTAGTDKTDAVCGDFVQNCHWKLPAGLWAGFILTIIISLIVVLLYRRDKRKSKQRGSVSVVVQGYSPPILPPDIIKPNSSKLQFFNDDSIFSNTDNCCLESDGITMTTITASEKYVHEVSYDQFDGLTSSKPSFLHSEPQEDEWPGA
ncbi:tumor necrosis factor receptor superfamily member 14 isoform X1 [Astyanax mexicanus]|uniref:tumor necrosis factor receptor superfamily member 14 isoform X1 n=1 Tax=Astyanax mexicanus TaxID=7994 RepID=UPI0020CB6A41|nr:tumor necrosis factor receptor superfamily member 14 isoform X1 [Astyanax mexicanus]